MTISPDRRARQAWQCSMGLYSLLLASLAIDHVFLRQAFHWPVLLLQCIPLLVIAPGLLRRRARSGIWLCFLVLFYFLSFVEHAALDSLHRPAYLGMLMVCISLFSSSVLFARWQRQVERLQTDLIDPDPQTH